MPNDGLGYDPRLLEIRASVAAVVMGVRIVVELQSHAGDRVVRTGHDEETVVVELLVGYRDKGLVLASVVPVQHAVRQPLGKPNVQNAFRILRLNGEPVFFVPLLIIASQFSAEATCS